MSDGRELKIFQLNDCDTYADYSLEEAKRHYLEMLGAEPEEESEYIDDPYELSEEELGKRMLTLMDEEPDKEGKYPKVAFKDYLTTIKTHCLFSSTEY